jgi:hypothetical protein
MHIDVGTVLRGTVCALYSNLVTRPTGAAVRTAIEQQVGEIGVPVVTVFPPRDGPGRPAAGTSKPTAG